MEASRAPARGISVGEVVSEAFSVYGQNLAALAGSAIVVLGMVGLAAGLLQSAGGVLAGLLAAVIRLAGYALYTGFVVRLVQDVRDGRRDQTVGDLFSAPAPAILPLIAFGVLFGIGVSVGLILLIVPGLILLTFWSVGAPAIVVEETGPLEAFGHSWRLVRGEAWSVFGVLLVVFVIVLAIQFVLVAIGAAIGDAGLVVAAVISTAVTAPIFALAVSVMYFDLGGGSPGTAPTTAAEPPPVP